MWNILLSDKHCIYICLLFEFDLDFYVVILTSYFRYELLEFLKAFSCQYIFENTGNPMNTNIVIKHSIRYWTETESSRARYNKSFFCIC